MKKSYLIKSTETGMPDAFILLTLGQILSEERFKECYNRFVNGPITEADHNKIVPDSILS